MKYLFKQPFVEIEKSDAKNMENLGEAKDNLLENLTDVKNTLATEATESLAQLRN